MKVLAVFLFAGLCVAPTAVSAATVYVSPSSPYDGPGTAWTNAFWTIQGGVDAASAADTVVVSNGTYALGGAPFYGALTNRVAIDKAITVSSLNGPADTFIVGNGPNGPGAVRCAYIGTNAVLAGFTLTNGHTPYSGDTTKEKYGGGAWCEDSGVVSNCVVTACKAYTGGGAAYGTYLSCTFSNNVASGVGGAASYANLSNCLVVANSASSGGGTRSCNSDGCIFIGNQASREGGATYQGSTSNSVVRGNTAVRYGGGCRLGTALNCTLYDNEAESGGGSYNTILENCTVVGNRAMYKGGGMYSGSAVNCIVYYNDALIGTNDNVHLYSYETCTYTCTDPVPVGAGNIGDPPELQSLVAPRLVITSPCIDAGTNEAWMAGATDIEGDPRISSTTVDMGADEVVMGAQSGAMTVEILTDWTNAVAGQPLRFEAHIEGDVAEFRWDWDDGTRTDNRCVAEHVFEYAGTYDVILEAGNKTDDAAATTTVTVVDSYITYVSPTGGHAPPFTEWAKAATNIQAAIDVCIPGGTVLVAEGDYDTGERLLWGSVSNRIAVDRPITVVADGSVKHTRIVGPGATNEDVSVRCAMLCDGALLAGFTLTEGLADFYGEADYLNQSGGGVWSATDGTVSNCIVTVNAAGENGGGVMGGTVVNSEVSANTAGYGGGGASYADARDCVISGNSAENYGGGIYQSTAAGCTLESNTGGDGGGAANSFLSNCIVTHNFGMEGGGTHESTVHNSILYGNMGIRGGGDHESDLYGCTITGNSAFRGGGVYSWGYGYGAVRNCTVVGNKASSCGGGTFNVDVVNSIVYFNTSGMEYDNIDIMEFGSCAYTCTTPDPGGEGNITAIPKLSGFYYPHIGKGSPCINAGTNQVWMATATDFDGEARIYGTTVDMGADEYDHDLVVGDPRTSMVADGTYGVAGFPMRFQAHCRGKVGRLEWIWGDGENDVGPCYLEHAFADPGDYQVVLDARSNDTIDAMTTTVHIVGGYTNYVSPTGSHTYPYESWATAATNIQTAVDANRYAGGIVLVTNGVYASGGKTKEHGILNRVLIDKAVVVRSLQGPAQTIIVGSGTDSVGEDYAVRCVYVGDRATLHGFTLAAGATDEDDDLERTLRTDGAGAWCEPEGRISHCVITGCVSYAYGGGAYQGHISDSLIYENESSDGGYGACRSTLENCTAWNNGTYDTYDCKLLNSIIEDVSGQEDFRASLCQYVCSYSGPGGEGNIEEEYPGFVDSDYGDYRLVVGSPCIDAGNNAMMQSLFDMDGLQRPRDGDADSVAVVDMGCYEFYNPSGDSDGDGSTDGDEYIADTDSMNSNDWFHVTAISNAPSITVCFQSSAARLYTLLGCTNLVEGIWSNVPGMGPRMGIGGADSMSATNDPPAEFYKVMVELP